MFKGLLTTIKIEPIMVLNKKKDFFLSLKRALLVIQQHVLVFIMLIFMSLSDFSNLVFLPIN